jgi:nitroreductase
MTQLSPLLAYRWSPRAFDPASTVADTELASMLEAARWAPSNGNSQPWRFLVGRRDDEAYKRILACLAPGNQRWAGRAAVLLLGAYTATDPAGAPLPHAAYDLGQAMAHLTVQATALRLHVHQMGGFDAAAIRAELELPEGVRPMVVAAIGQAGDPRILPEDLQVRETALRQRRPVSDLLLPI